MKQSRLLALLVCISLASASCGVAKSRLAGAIPGSGNVQTETRDLAAFTTIRAEYPGADVIVQQGDKQAIQIQAEDNVIPQIATNVSSDRLTIANNEPDWKARVNPSKPVKVTVTVKDLSEIDFAAPVGTLQMSDFQAPTLKLILSGGAQVKINGIQVDLLDSVLSGAGDIQVNGTADEIKLILSGLGNFNAADLQSNKATIQLSGMGNATVHVESDLSATVSGAGSVNYFGNPHVEKNVSGAGSVKAAE
jgi:hypothetical protein